MFHVIDFVLLAAAVILLVPLIVFSAECLLGLLPRYRRASPETGPAPRVVVLIPAHNEEAVIAHTLSALLPTLSAEDEVLVVADNCNDTTAEVARACGATVVERQDAVRRGKGYALDCGVRHLERQPRVPEVVVVVDADCTVDPGTIHTLARRALQTNRPAQALYLCEAKRGGAALHGVSELGFRFKCLVRVAGLARLGLPCPLMGTGMAFPWSIMKTAPLAGGNIVEDMQLGIDLAIAGHAPLFCPDARVTSQLPQQERAFLSQRTRWEHGHLRTAFTQIPRLILAGLRQRRLHPLSMALDLCVPPLSLLVLTWMAVTLIAVGAWALGISPLPALLLASGGGLMTVSILAGWAAWCRPAIPFSLLLSIPAYIARKLPIYASFFLRRAQVEWVRTERDAVASPRAEATGPLP